MVGLVVTSYFMTYGGGCKAFFGGTTYLSSSVEKFVNFSTFFQQSIIASSESKISQMLNLQKVKSGIRHYM